MDALIQLQFIIMLSSFGVAVLSVVVALLMPDGLVEDVGHAIGVVAIGIAALLFLVLMVNVPMRYLLF